MSGPNRLDRAGFSKAHAMTDGTVRLELWCEDRTGLDDPARYTMTPGQAIGLVESLAAAARHALKEQVA